MDRRAFSKTLIDAVASFALLRAVTLTDAFAQPIRPLTDRWLRNLHAMATEVYAGTITPGEWQTQIHALYQQVPLGDLVAQIDFEALRARVALPDLGVGTAPVRFPRLDGLPERLAFHSKLFGMRRDRAIIPHGHRNMVSCHYILQGALHLRHYDKVEDDGTHLTIAPTIDTEARAGSFSAISDTHNNIHWMRGLTERAYTFDVIVLDLDGEAWDVDNIDPDEAERIGGGLLRAPKLDVETALAKYGHASHH